MTNFYEGGSLTKLGENCFYGDKKLKTITLNSKKLTKTVWARMRSRVFYSKADIAGAWQQEKKCT